MITDPENGDYSLLPNSPASGYGCITFPENKYYPYNSFTFDRKNSLVLNGDRLEVEGEINENTHWTADTVTVVGDLIVNNGIVLMIDPGVVIEFTGFYSINVSGTIIAEGIPDERIVFRSETGGLFHPDSTETGSWNGIKFINTQADNEVSIFRYCIFENSKSLNEDIIGGVFYCYNYSKLKIENSVFRCNLAVFGSAIGCDYNSSPQITGNLFYENYAILAGSPFYIKYSHPIFNYNTIVSNVILNEDEWYVTGIFHTYIAKPQLTGNIIRNNLTNYFFQDQILEGKAIYIGYNNIEFGFEGTGNIDLPALFLMEEPYPYSLLNNSPCIDAGINQLTWDLQLPPTDLAGEDRIYNNTIDMGAYEWRSTNAEDDIVDPEQIILVNYPNPFNPSTIISFQVSDNSFQNDVELIIYNLKGQKLKKYSLFNFQNSITWDGTDNNNNPVPSGIYFCRVKIGNIIASRKMILLK
ncbi:choice-of-anchor Q domain-containing protein [Candidatus Cloacimonadota bacterium]